MSMGSVAAPAKAATPTAEEDGGDDEYEEEFKDAATTSFGFLVAPSPTGTFRIVQDASPRAISATQAAAEEADSVLMGIVVALVKAGVRGELALVSSFDVDGGVPRGVPPPPPGRPGVDQRPPPPAPLLAGGVGTVEQEFEAWLRNVDVGGNLDVNVESLAANFDSIGQVMTIYNDAIVDVGIEDSFHWCLY